MSVLSRTWTKAQDIVFHCSSQNKNLRIYVLVYISPVKAIQLKYFLTQKSFLWREGERDRERDGERNGVWRLVTCNVAEMEKKKTCSF